MEPELTNMSTPAQIHANQQNSKLSTGPRTIEGKAVASRNHTVHGLCAADPVLPSEDRNKFGELVEQYKLDWNPATAHHEFLVSQMAGVQWKLNRIERMEIDMLAALDDPTKAFTDKETSAGFARLERYRASLERTYHRCVRELRADQKQRAALQNEAKSAQAAENKFVSLLARLYEGPSDEYLKMTIAEHRQKQAAAAGSNATS